MTVQKSKLELLQEFAAKDPKNPFPRYGIAMELVQLERLDEAAAAFDALARDFPAYVATYFHAGKVLEKLGRLDDARAFYTRGIDQASRAGQGHAREELEAALGLLG
jgi:tetratricopeptide (TPR) repeat protein